MTIACFNTNNLRGIDPYSRKVYYLDDPVHLLVSCAKLCNAMVLSYHVFGAITGDYESCEKVLFTISRTKFLAPLPGIVQVLSKLLVTSVPRSGNNTNFFGVIARDCSSLDN